MKDERSTGGGVFLLALLLLLMLVPIGGVLFMWGANLTFHDWLGATDKISFKQSCGAMLLLWLASISFMSKAN